MNLVYGLALHEFSVAQVKQSACLVFGRSLVPILSKTQIFSLSHARDKLIISFLQYGYTEQSLPNISTISWSLYTKSLFCFAGILLIRSMWMKTNWPSGAG